MQARELLEVEPFVRELDEVGEVGDERLRLYVEQGETALPVVLRVLDRAGSGGGWDLALPARRWTTCS